MLVFFFLFLKISAVTYTTACARIRLIVFERHQRSDFFVVKLYGMRAHAPGAVHALARAARAGPPATAWLLSRTRRQRRKVEKCRVADKKQTDKPTDKPTNKHTLLFYRYRRADQGRLRPKIKYDSVRFEK